MHTVHTVMCHVQYKQMNDVKCICVCMYVCMCVWTNVRMYNMYTYVCIHVVRMFRSEVIISKQVQYIP